MRGTGARPYLLLLCAGLLALWTPPAAAEGCGAWPGEPMPLPSLTDPDPVRARWAELRVAEVAYRARALEASRPVEAHRLWSRVLCFDAGSAEAREGLARTRPVLVHRPVVVKGKLPEDARNGADPWAGLGRPLAVRAVAKQTPRPMTPAQAAERTRLLAEIDADIDATDALVREARFEEALGRAGEVRSALTEMRWEDDLLRRWVRLEVAEATVQIALGRDDQARACAARALARDPGLVIDPRRTSPKVVRVFEAARAEQGGP